MDPELPGYYQRELRYIHELFLEFARQHPKIARRLGAQAGDVGDPYVGRLLQSFALTAARSQMRIDRFPLEIPMRRLDGVDLNLTAPLPSLGVARFYPDAQAAHSAQGLTLPRGTRLTIPAAEDATECVFLTSQLLRLWPVEITRAKPTGIPADVPALSRYVHDSQDASRVRGALRLRLRTVNGMAFRSLEGLDELPVYLCGEEKMASQLFELIHTSVVGIVMGVPGEFEKGDLYGAKLPGMPYMRVKHAGLEPDESLLRPVATKLHGHRLVHEFFVLPSRFGFFTITGLAAGLKHIDGPEVEIVLLLARAAAMPDQQIGVPDFALYCTPIVNLYPATSERLTLDAEKREHRLTPMADRPDDYEVHSVDRVRGQREEEPEKIPFQPLDAALPDDTRRNPRYFRLRREQERVADNERRYDTHREFVRTLTSIRLLGEDRELDETGIRFLTLDAWLTNGELPCVQPRNGVDDLAVADAKAVGSVGFVRGPTAPRPPLALGAQGDAAWELIRQLHLELAVFDDEFNEPAPGEGLRLMLRPYLGAGDPAMARFLDSLVGATASAVNDMHRWGEELHLARGVAITLTFDESRLDGWSPFTFALALERYVARHVSAHCFTRTTLRTSQRGEIFTFPTRGGTRGVF
ncbi:type VI secretion system baseplate subunit TssF [Paraburkholderia aromaticivorans]|uniref:type VI secretion system baseplate subunit TssF n=1 Tax=Paraburkholderia aromaticivorans TaxID=2026199 RepID=UPI001F0F469E|nr:type VI secretion system baseplate subunit TssF [Paraburkholderia aromaticivorans]